VKKAILFYALFLFGFTALSGQNSDEEDLEDYTDFGADEGITVTQTPERPAQELVITREDIERIAAPDVATLLEEALDMPITRHGAYGNSSDVNMRGFSTERIAILIDGVPANSAMSGDFDFYTLPMNNIERIEVIYGGGDSKYNVSGALGGVINIVTKKKQPPGWRFGFGFYTIAYLPGAYTEWNGEKKKAQPQDLIDTQKLDGSISWGSERFSFGAHLFLDRAENHYLFLDSFLYKIRRKQHNEVWDVGGGAFLSWNFTNLAKLIVNIDAYYSDRTLPATGFSAVEGKQYDVTVRDNIMFEAPVFLRDDISMEASVSHNYGGMEYALNNTTPSRHDQNGVALINRWAWYMMKTVTLRAGWDFRFIFMDSTGTGTRSRPDGGAYITAEIDLARTLRIIPSLKLSTDGSAAVPVPKLGILWNPLDFITVKNNYFRSFKFPDFDDLYWTGLGYSGNPDLHPEDGWGIDAAAELRWRSIASLEETLFFQYTRDSIHWHQGLYGWEPQNIGEAAFFGSDTRLKADFPVSLGPVKKISPQASYQFLLTYLLSYGYSWEDAKRIPYQPMHTFGAAVDVSWGSGSVMVSGHYESVRYYTVTNTIELVPYLLLNVNVNQNIGEYLRVFAVFRNLLNRSYESYNRYPMPGFNITLGVRMSGYPFIKPK
jgi:vitamin B12 transporter